LLKKTKKEAKKNPERHKKTAKKIRQLKKKPKASVFYCGPHKGKKAKKKIFLG
jgi:hypothetical protein